MKNRLANALKNVKPVSCFCGFDGFVDEVVHTVDRRFDAETYSRVPTLAEYGKRIAGASGLSINVEIVTVDKKLGGNGPIFANALKRYGASIVYIGSVGKDAVDPVFADLAAGSTVIGIADPGRTDAMEFSDGKIIRSKLFALSDVKWESVLARVGLDAFVEYMDGADLISFNNWTMLPHMTALWNGILEQAVPRMKTANKREKTLFFDLADPEKRTREDLLEALEKIGAFHRAGFYTILGLNKKEACEVAEAFGLAVRGYREHPLEELAMALSARLDTDCLVIHPVDCAACVVGKTYYAVGGPYCENPRLTTGAGDNFNAGFIFGMLQKFPPEQCLLLGVATSGFYVRECRSPTIEEARAFLTRWDAGELDSCEDRESEI